MMTLADIDAWLPRLYYISQIMLMFVALCAAVFVYIQIRTFKRFELFKVLEDPRVKSARRTIFRKTRQPDSGEWWRTDDDAEEAAGIICASFDVVGHLAKGANRRFFARYWWYTICWTHEALEGYLASRSKENINPYQGYTDLYRAAKRHDSRPVRSAPQNSN